MNKKGNKGEVEDFNKSKKKEEQKEVAEIKEDRDAEREEDPGDVSGECRISSKILENLDYSMESEMSSLSVKGKQKKPLQPKPLITKKKQYMTRREVTEARIVNNILTCNNPAGQSAFEDLFIVGNKYAAYR